MSGRAALWGNFMQVRKAVQLAYLLLIASFAVSPRAEATDNKPLPTNPVGAHGNGTTSVTKEAAVAAAEFDKRQLALIQKVSLYFNQMSDLKGVFVQTG